MRKNWNPSLNFENQLGAYDEGLNERDDLDEVLEENTVDVAVAVGVGGGVSEWGLRQVVSRGRVGFPFRVPEIARIVLQFQEMLWLVHRLVLRLYKYLRLKLKFNKIESQRESERERVAGLCFQNRFISVNQQRFSRKDPFLFCILISLYTIYSGLPLK